MQARGHERPDALRHGVELRGLPIDEAIARLAARQHGVVGRRQLLAAGASPEAIGHRLARHRLHPVYRAVYSVGRPLLPFGRPMAAVLACGPGAVLSHRGAAALWGLLPAGSGRVEVTTPRLGARRRAGIALRRTRRLPPEEATVHDRLPCTTVARTLVDLAAVEPPRRLRRALEQSLVLRLFDLRAVEEVLGHARGRRGTGALRRLLGEVSDEPPVTNSELERRFLELVRAGPLPFPVVNGLVAGHEVDFHWPAHRLIVETDGRAAHGHPLAFHRDRRRDIDLELAGWHVVRVTWRDVVREPERLTALLRYRLEPAGGRRRPSGPAAAFRPRS